MKLSVALAAVKVEAIDAVLSMRLNEVQLDMIKCGQFCCDLNRTGECTVGYCRRTDKYLSK